MHTAFFSIKLCTDQNMRAKFQLKVVMDDLSIIGCFYCCLHFKCCVYYIGYINIALFEELFIRIEATTLF